MLKIWSIYIDMINIVLVLLLYTNNFFIIFEYYWMFMYLQISPPTVLWGHASAIPFLLAFWIAECVLCEQIVEYAKNSYEEVEGLQIGRNCSISIFVHYFKSDTTLLSQILHHLSHKLFYCHIILIWFYSVNCTHKITTIIRFSIFYTTNTNLFYFTRWDWMWYLFYDIFQNLCVLWKTTLRNVFTFLETIYFVTE